MKAFDIKETRAWEYLSTMLIGLSYMFGILGLIITLAFLCLLIPASREIFIQALQSDWSGFRSLSIGLSIVSVIIFCLYIWIQYYRAIALFDTLASLFSRIGFVSFWILLVFNLDLSAIFQIIHQSIKQSSTWPFLVWGALSFMAFLFVLSVRLMFNPKFRLSEHSIQKTIGKY